MLIRLFIKQTAKYNVIIFESQAAIQIMITVVISLKPCIDLSGILITFEPWTWNWAMLFFINPFHHSKLLWGTSFKRYTKDFKFHGNKFTDDIYQSWRIAWSLWFFMRSLSWFDRCFRNVFSHLATLKCSWCWIYEYLKCW